MLISSALYLLFKLLLGDGTLDKLTPLYLRDTGQPKIAQFSPGIMNREPITQTNWLTNCKPLSLGSHLEMLCRSEVSARKICIWKSCNNRLLFATRPSFFLMTMVWPPCIRNKSEVASKNQNICRSYNMNVNNFREDVFLQNFINSREIILSTKYNCSIRIIKILRKESSLGMHSYINKK